MSIRRLCTLLFVGSLLILSPAGGADQPPQPLHLVGDHWTAWDPPSEFPEGSKVHVIVRGDTLWALAAQHLGNPYLWPQIWEKNQYILDAHWIYPGDPLAIELAVAPAEEQLTEVMSPVGAEAAPAAEGDTPADSSLRVGPATTGGPVALGYEDEIYCSGFIGGDEEGFPFAITGSEYQVLSPKLTTDGRPSPRGVYGVVDSVKITFSPSDIVYLDGGNAAGLYPGEVLVSALPLERVRHPATREVFGRFYKYLGRLRVLSVQETSAIAEVVHACDGLVVGSKLRVFEPEPVPLARRSPMRPINDPPTAASLTEAPVILRAQDGIVSIGQDHVVFIDRGFDEQVGPGDIYTIYRMNREGYPPVVLGELAVLSAQPHSATARVIESRFPIYVGDRLERK